MVKLTEFTANIAPSGAGISLDNIDTTIEMRDSTISYNTATNVGGGGLLNDATDVTITRTQVYGNSATNSGGGLSIQNKSSVALKHSTIGKTNSNLAKDGAGLDISGTSTTVTIDSCTLEINYAIGSNSTTGFGGGARIDKSSSVLIANTTISGNSASNRGGGLAFPLGVTHDQPNYNIQNSTIYGNYADQGGGIFVDGDNKGGMALRIYNSTIAANEATNGGNDQKGGGIFFKDFKTADLMLLDSTIVALNKADNGGPDIYSVATGGQSPKVTGDHSLVGVDTNGFAQGSTWDGMLNGDPGFVTVGLNDNGGPTWTVRLRNDTVTSQAIDTGKDTPTLTLPWDQRGAFHKRIVGEREDIGAFESNEFATVNDVIFNADSSGNPQTQRSLVKRIVVIFSEEVDFLNDVADAFTLYRHGTGGTTGNVSITTDPATGPASTVTITFEPSSLTEYESLIDGFYDFTIDASQVSTTAGDLDGDGDGDEGGNYEVIGTLANKYFRLFGDFDGDGSVTQTPDFIEFRNAFGVLGPGIAIFDFDDDGSVEQDDFIQFRNRFGGSP